MNLIQKTNQNELDLWCRRNDRRTRYGARALTLEEFRTLRALGKLVEASPYPEPEAVIRAAMKRSL